MMQSPLDQIIPPEIRDDEFYHLLRDLTAREPIITALEIGSSSGDGSTAALVDGLSRNRTRPMLYCLEASQSRFCQLSERYAQTPFVRCLNASSVTVDKFPSESAVEFFWHNSKTNLSLYPLATVLNWLRDDIRYLKESGVEQGGIAAIKISYGIDRFDLVLIDGSEFTGEAELDELIGARWIALDDINAYKNLRNYQRLSKDPDYKLIAENWQLRNGYALFRHIEAPLPVHFFTIVLNGMPFMPHHIEAFRHLPFRWHWHIVEGAAELVADTAWSRPNGGYVPDSFNRDGLSIDGTGEYIDQLKRLFPDNVTVYRKPAGQLWQGKLTMVNAPLDSIQEECLLWEIDADECWSHVQLCAGWRLFNDEPERTAAFYWCHFFVGPHLVVNSRNCYSQVAGHEWLRTWRYRPGYRWVAHEPPRLMCLGPDGDRDIARQAPYSNDETEAKGLVFQHFAYVTADQVRFKEKYYGYSQATYHWLQLQKERNFPVRLGDYLPWVTDRTTVDTVTSQGIIPFPVVGNSCRQKQISGGPIIIDGVFFQYYATGIARVWLALLEELSGTGFASQVVILDRGKTVPRLPGYCYLDIPLHNESDIPGERAMLQRVCGDLSAALFISTWHTSPLSTPTLLMVHDLLPEILLGEKRFDAGRWQEKKLAIEHAQAFIAVSENSAKDLVTWYPEAGMRPIHIIHNGVSSAFRPATPERIKHFKEWYGITKPYFLFVGPRVWYKNFRLLLDAFLLLPEPEVYCIVSPHKDTLEGEFAGHPGSAFVRLTGRLSDEDLVAAYSGAVALVFPSLYEGFGLPPLEAMACGCPVIISTALALVEVCGDAAIQVKSNDCEALALAMVSLLNQRHVAENIRRGLERAAVFSWHRSASQIVRAICTQLGGSPGLDKIMLERKRPI
ncbi:MAG TPA: glycosyltransferase family 4 protein [Desulfuromonadales bacterium]|nr:glycosyltransferase family 4 protein [Desulfuromonadales bacterium]